MSKSNKELLDNKFKKLKKYRWGLGLEHEMHIFHKPNTNNITDFILFDGEMAHNRIEQDIADNKIKIIKRKRKYTPKEAREEKDNEIFKEDYEYFKTVPFEKTGRKCNGKYVIESVPCKMPEFIIDEPICYLENGRDSSVMCQELIMNKKLYLKILMKNKKTEQQVKKYGEN